MRNVSRLVTTLTVLLIARPSPAQTPPTLSIRNLMSAEQFRAAGLQKLTPDELRNLDGWIADFAMTAMGIGLNQTLGGVPRARSSEYIVEASSNDELFVIDGEAFEAKTFCFGVERGDKVIFTHGSPAGICLSAEFIVLRTGRKCSCWCK